MKKFYVYKITNTVNGKYYIGVHGSYDIYNDSYLGSGKIIKHLISKYVSQSLNRQILFQFNTQQEAYNKQREIVNQQFIQKDNTYNIVLGGKGWLENFIYAFNKEGQLQYVSKDDIRWEPGELYTRIIAKDKYGNKVSTHKNDPKWISGQYVGHTKGCKIKSLKGVNSKYIVAKDKSGRTYRILSTDQRWFSGELVGITSGNTYENQPHKGRKQTEQHKAKRCNALKKTNALKRKMGLIISSSTTGKRCLNNGTINKYVIENQIESYLNCGWKFGRLW